MTTDKTQDEVEAVEGLFAESKIKEIDPAAFCKYCHMKKEHCVCRDEADSYEYGLK